MQIRYRFIPILITCFILIHQTSCIKDKEIIPIFEIQREFKDNWNNLPSLVANKIDQSVYDSLNLNKLDFIPSYDYSDLVVDVLSSNDSLNTKLVLLTVINSGEIIEYLMTYNQDVLIDDLMVYYEDNVEYYQQITSSIINDSVCVTSVRWNDDHENYAEKSDTIIENYLLTPTLHFEKIN